MGSQQKLWPKEIASVNRFPLMRAASWWRLNTGIHVLLFVFSPGNFLILLMIFQVALHGCGCKNGTHRHAEHTPLLHVPTRKPHTHARTSQLPIQLMNPHILTLDLEALFSLLFLACVLFRQPGGCCYPLFVSLSALISLFTTSEHAHHWPQ
jgi:hypothetical protein